MKAQIMDSKENPNGSKTIFIQVEVEEFINRSLNAELVEGIRSELVKVISEDLKKEIEEKIKANIVQLVKDVGVELTMAGLKSLVSKKENKNENN